MRPGEDTSKLSPEQLGRAWQIHSYAENLFSHRMNYGMVAQSMLMVSFVTMFAYQNQVPKYSVLLEIIIAILGTFYSAFQYMRGRELTTRIQFFQTAYLVPNDPMFAAYMQSTRYSWHIRHHQVVLAFGCGWLLLLGLAIISYLRP